MATPCRTYNILLLACQKSNRERMVSLDLKTDKAYELKEFVNLLGILDEASLKVGKSGLHIKAMDPSSISMVEADLSKNLFSKWDVDEGTITVDVDRIREALRHIKKADKLSVNTIKTDKEATMLQFSIGKEKIEIPYSNETKEEPKREPKTEFTATATLQAKPLKDFLAKAKKIDSHVLVVAKNNKLILFCKGDGGNIRAEMPAEVQTKKEVAARFTIEFLSKMLKAAGKNTKISMDLKTDEPVKLTECIAESPPLLKVG